MSDVYEDRLHPPNPCFPPERTIAIVDHRSCSMAAVRHAIPFATGGTRPLTVLLIKPEHTILAALGGFAVPASWNSDLQAEFVAETAAVVTPSGIRWDFGVLDAGSSVEHWCGDGAAQRSLVVTVRHLERRLRSPRPLRTVTFRADRPQPPLLVVACDGRTAFRA